MSFQNLFAYRLKELRIAKGLSQTELAAELDISLKTYNNWEIKARIPLLETLCKLAAYFNVTLDYLTGYDYLSGNHTDDDSTLDTAI